MLKLSYSNLFQNTLNYVSIANIEEVMKFYNLGDKTFETDFSYLIVSRKRQESNISTISKFIHIVTAIANDQMNRCHEKFFSVCPLVLEL